MILHNIFLPIRITLDKVKCFIPRVEENRSKFDLHLNYLFIREWSGKRLIRIDDRGSRRKMRSSTTMLNSTPQRNRSVWIFLKVETSPEASNVPDVAASRQRATPATKSGSANAHGS